MSYELLQGKQGALSGKLKNIGEKYNASVSQIAIAWAIAKGISNVIKMSALHIY